MLDDEVLAPEPAGTMPSDAPAPEPEPSRIGPFRRRLLIDYLPIVVLLAAVAYFCKVFYQPGHDWGDDFALYIHQAMGLVHGNAGEVAALNRYTVDNSGWNSFSPLVYPWGFPILIAPIVAIWGANYAKLKLFVICTFLGYLFCLYRLVLRRAGPLGAALVVALLGSSIWYVGFTSSVLSDYPYLLFSMFTLLWIDRVRTRELTEGDGIRDLIILGFLIGFSFSIRREGLGLLAALFALQAVAIGPRLLRRAQRYAADRMAKGRDADTVPDVDDPPLRWARIGAPWAAFAVTVVGLQLVLPSELWPHWTGGGVKQIKPNVIWFRDILAEQIGLKDIGVNKIQLLGSWNLAAIALTLLVGLAVVGLVARVLIATAEDAPVAAYLVGVLIIVGTQPFHEGRYLLGVTPLLAYFAYQALPTMARWARLWVKPAIALSALGLAGLVVANWTDMSHALSYHRVYNGTINGPTSQPALEMEQKVIACTRGTDVVVFFRARAMSMLTERRSIQTGSADIMMQRGDWYVMAKGSDYSQPLISDDQARRLGLRKIWENSEWVLWLIPGGAADGRRLPC
jgi:hypothetical protein